MCQQCEENRAKLARANDHIASLLDAIKVGTGSPWEYSEPYIIGGVAGKYTVISPYLYGCEWKADLAVAGASSSEILISSSSKETTSVPDLTGANNTNFTGLSGLDGLLLNIPSNNMISVDSEWYSIRNSDNKLYVIVSNGANAAYVNIVFRQKRK